MIFINCGELLGETAPAFCQLAEPFLFGGHDAEGLQGGDEAVAGGAVVAEDEVTALFAAEVVAVLPHFIDDVFIAHISANDFASSSFDGGVEAGVAHHGRHQRVVGE